MRSLGWGSAALGVVALVLSGLYLMGVDRPRRLFAWMWAFDSVLPAAITGAILLGLGVLAFRRARLPATSASVWGARLGWGLVMALLGMALFVPVGCSVGFHVPPPSTRCDTVTVIVFVGGHDLLGWIRVYALGLPLAVLLITILVLTAFRVPSRER